MGSGSGTSALLKEQELRFNCLDLASRLVDRSVINATILIEEAEKIQSFVKSGLVPLRPSTSDRETYPRNKCL